MAKHGGGGKGIPLLGGLAVVMLAAGCGSTAVATKNPGAISRGPVDPAAESSRSLQGLTMRSERGAIDSQDAEDAIARNFQRLVRCYQAAGDATQFAEGGVTLQFSVGLDGRPLSVALQSSRVGNVAVEQCLIAEGLQIHFPRPHGHARASFEYSLEFRSTDERAVIDLADPPEGFRNAVLARIGSDCGALGTGAFTATIYVDRKGQVLSAGIAGQKPIAAESARCAASALGRASLPAPDALGGALARIVVDMNADELATARELPAAPPKKARIAKGRGSARRAPVDNVDRSPLATDLRRRR